MFLLLACHEDAPAARDTGEETPEDTGPVVPAATAELGAEEVAVALSVALGDAVPNMVPVARAVTELFDAGDETCPGPEVHEYSISQFDPAGCTSLAGYWFQGAGAFAMGLEDDEGDGKAERFVAELKMDMSGADPDGAVLEVGGDSTLTAALGDAGPESFEGFFAGTYRWTGDPGWLGEGVSAGLLFAAEVVEGGSAVVWLDGGVTVGEATAVGFDAVELGGECGAAPTGAALLRSEDGRWYRLEFDGETCDGCGIVTFAGEELGPACLDLETPVGGMVGSLYDWTSERLPMLEAP